MAHDDDVVVVLTTVPAGHDAEGMARTLLDARLVACVSILPVMRSMYRWQGAVDSADECQVLLKTRRERLPELEQALSAVHPYDVPEFLVVSADGGSRAYLEWIGLETAPADVDGGR